jgi:hypothetical protein
LGEITFTDQNGNNTGQYKPNEFAVDADYARKLSERFSLAIAGRFIYSNLTLGQYVGGQQTKPGVSAAADIAGYYRKPYRKTGKPNKELRKRVLNDLRYCITTSLCVPDINEYMAFKIHHEFERKELVTDGESWQRLCVLINPRNQRIYHNLSSAFIVSDSNHEGHLTSFTCGQLHYGPLFRAGSLMNITKGPMTS